MLRKIRKSKGVSLKFTSLFLNELLTDFVFDADFCLSQKIPLLLLFITKWKFHFHITKSILINAENEAIFIKMNILDKTQVIGLLLRHVLRDVLEKCRKHHLQVMKK